MQIHRTLRRMFHTALIFSFVFGFFTVLQAPSAQAQSRVNDKDMKALMRNLRDDAKSFRPEFDSAVQKSTIRKTSQEKDARDQAAAFVRQTDALLNRFKHTRNGQAEFNNVMNTAEQIDSVVNSLRLGQRVTDHWGKIRTELHQIAAAYGIQEPFRNRDRDMNGTPGTD